MDQITVIIPPQVYNRDKYLGIKQMCYLYEALYKAGHNVTEVGGSGRSEIDGYEYNPIEVFNSFIVEQAFTKEKSITVTLVKQNS